jgi:hypothetical protein
MMVANSSALVLVAMDCCHGQSHINPTLMSGLCSGAGLSERRSLFASVGDFNGCMKRCNGLASPFLARGRLALWFAL